MPSSQNHRITMKARHQFLQTRITAQQPPEETDDQCSICISEFVDAVKLPCNHLYCRDCISEWLTRRDRNTCPTCRAAFFALNEADRGPAGLRVVAEALRYSGLMTEDGFDVYHDELSFPGLEVQRTATAASQYLVSAPEAPAETDEGFLIEIRQLGPHIIAMGNLLRGYARAAGRPWSGYQRRDWKLIVGRLMTLLEAINGQTRQESSLRSLVREYRGRIKESLGQDLLDVRSGRFFESDVRMESPSGDLDVLLHYVFFQASRAYREREKMRRELRWEQELALQQETSGVGWALRWVGQAVFGGV